MTHWLRSPTCARRAIAVSATVAAGCGAPVTASLPCTPSAPAGDAAERAHTPAEKDRVVIGRDVHPPTHSTCSAEAVEQYGLRETLEGIAVRVEGTTSDVDARSVAAQLHELARSPCYRLLPGPALGNDITSRGLRWFWQHGGRDWAFQVLERGASSRVVPPPVPRSLDAAGLPPTARSWVCSSGDDACSATTEPWRVRAERTINAIGQSPPFTFRRPCRRGLTVPGWSALDLELECQAADAGVQYLLPLGSVAVPEHAVLTSNATSGKCEEWRAAELSQGRSLVVSRCGTAAPQVAWGTTSAQLLRESVFALIVAPHVAFGAAPSSLEAPPDLPAESSLGRFPEGIDFGATASSSRVTHSWALVWSHRTTLTGQLAWPPEQNSPPGTYAAWLLDSMDASWQTGCGAVRDYAPLALALMRAAPSLADTLAPLGRAKSVPCSSRPPARLGALEPLD